MGTDTFWDAFTAEDWTERVVGSIEQILDLTAEMYGYTCSLVVYGEQDEDPEGEISERYLEILTGDRLLRRQVVEYLANADSDTAVAPALQLLDVLDASVRIGALTTEYYQVSLLLDGDQDRELYQEHLLGRTKSLEDLLALTTMAFSDRDQERAGEIIERITQLISETEDTIAELADSHLSTKDGICITATCRLYIHIAWSLSSIARSLVSPIDTYEAAGNEAE